MIPLEGVEILHLSKEVMVEGTLFLREFAYMNTNEIYTRVSSLKENLDEDGWETTGWYRLNGPNGEPVNINIESLYELAFLAGRRGWEVVWNPEYEPVVKEFVKKVDF